MSKELALLIHSGGFSSRQWRRLAEALAPDHRVLSPDLLGYGSKGAWPDGEPFHFQQDRAMLEALVEGAGGGPAHVVGHSYGGLLGLHLALARPDLVRSLALFEPVAFGILDEPSDVDAHQVLGRLTRRFDLGEEGAGEAWLAQFVDWWNGAGAWAGLAEETKASFRAVSWKLSQEVSSLMADTTGRATYGSIGAPTLLLGGERSPLPERRVLDKLAAALPRATLEVLPGVGHMGPITHAPSVNAAIVAHIKACSA